MTLHLLVVATKKSELYNNTALNEAVPHVVYTGLFAEANAYGRNCNVAIVDPTAQGDAGFERGIALMQTLKAKGTYVILVDEWERDGLKGHWDVPREAFDKFYSPSELLPSGEPDNYSLTAIRGPPTVLVDAVQEIIAHKERKQDRADALAELIGGLWRKTQE